MGLAWQLEQPPYFHARRAGADVRLDGLRAAELGHRVDLGAGRSPGGNWVEWSWDGSALTLRNDRYRGYPIYVAADREEIAISPSIEQLLRLGISRELDLDAIAAFLTLGHFVGEDTAFTAVRQLPGNATLEWRPGHLRTDADPPRRRHEHGTRKAAIATTAELVRAAVRRCIPEDGGYVMPISGGRDSRHILLELLEAGHRPVRCVTAHHHPHVWGGDVAYAAGLCRELGLAHEVVAPGPLVAEEVRKNRMTSFCTDEHAWFPVVGSALAAGGTHTYEGLNGSTAWIRDFYSPKMRRLSRAGRFSDLARSLGRRYRGQPRYLALLSASRREQLGAERAVLRITRELERHGGESDPYLAFRFWGRTMGELNLPSTLMLAGLPRAYTPFLDPDVTEHAWTVPSEVIDDDFHAAVIDHRFPRFRHIPYRPRTRPRPPRSFLRRVNRDVFELLRQYSDGSLVDRRRLMGRTAAGAVTGSDWITWGRRSALAIWLVQLEALARGDDAAFGGR